MAELDRFLSELAGVPAAVAVHFVSGRAGFDPVLWSVSLSTDTVSADAVSADTVSTDAVSADARSAGGVDPDVWVSALLHENVHKEQIFLTWRWLISQASDRPGSARELAERVGTVNYEVAALALAAGPLAAGSAEFEAASQWWAEDQGGAAEPARIRSAAFAAYGRWRAAVAAVKVAAAEGVGQGGLDELAAAAGVAERDYALVWPAYATSVLEVPAFAAQAVLRRQPSGGPDAAAGPDVGVEGEGRDDEFSPVRTLDGAPSLSADASEDSRRVVNSSRLASLRAGTTVYWPADARRVREVIRDRGRLTLSSSPTGGLGPGHYTFLDPEGGLRQAVEVDIDIPVLVELRLRRAAVGLLVGDTATTEDRSEEDLAAVLDEYDFLTGADGGLLKFHPRFVDNVDVLRVSVGTDGLHWRRHRQFLAEVPQSIAGWLMTQHPDLVSEPRTYEAISAMLGEFGHEAPFEVVEPLRVHSHQAAGETVPALSKERMDAFLDVVWDMRNDSSRARSASIDCTAGRCPIMS